MIHTIHQRFATIEKMVGETPLDATKRLRATLNLDDTIPLAYAGRLDPMASGKLLILIGNECKQQEKYHGFDKRYVVEILFGAHSDTGDVLGIISPAHTLVIEEGALKKELSALRGTQTFAYPTFSSRTVQGKPLHMWTLEGRLSEIVIPTYTANIYDLTLLNLRTVQKSDVLKTVRKKIETIPPVTDVRKTLGKDFRRDDVRVSWSAFEATAPETLHIATISCVCTAGTYMRTLAEHIGKKLNTEALAYSIHRTHIGTYFPILKNLGLWTKRF